MNLKATAGLILLNLLGVVSVSAQQITSIASILERDPTTNEPVLKSQTVTVSGVVLAGAGITETMGKKRYLLYDSTGGVRIFNLHSDYEPVTGDSVLVKGQVLMQAGMPALVQRSTTVLGKGVVPEPTVTDHLDSTLLYQWVELRDAYLQDVSKWGRKYNTEVITETDTVEVYGSNYSGQEAPYGHFTLRGICDRVKAYSGGYTYHLVLSGQNSIVTRQLSPIIRFEKTRSRIFSNQSGDVGLILDQPLGEDGWVKIRLTNSGNIQYGPQENYTTTPPAVDGIISLPIPKDTKHVSFQVNVNSGELLKMGDQMIQCEVLDTSPGIGSVKEATAVIKIH